MKVQTKKLVTSCKQKLEYSNGIKTRIKCMQPAPSAGKRVQASHDWLVKKVARDFLTNHRAQQCKSDHEITFYTQN